MTATEADILRVITILFGDWTDDSKYRSPAWEPYKVDTVENIGDNWLIADFGTDMDGKNYILSTNYVHASESHQYTKGAKEDAELVCALLNRIYHETIGKRHSKRDNRGVGI